MLHGGFSAGVPHGCEVTAASEMHDVVTVTCSADSWASRFTDLEDAAAADVGLL